jgi:hypothetical protein
MITPTRTCHLALADGSVAALRGSATNAPPEERHRMASTPRSLPRSLSVGGGSGRSVSSSRSAGSARGQAAQLPSPSPAPTHRRAAGERHEPDAAHLSRVVAYLQSERERLASRVAELEQACNPTTACDPPLLERLREAMGEDDSSFTTKELERRVLDSLRGASATAAQLAEARADLHQASREIGVLLRERAVRILVQSFERMRIRRIDWAMHRLLACGPRAGGEDLSLAELAHLPLDAARPPSTAVHEELALAVQQLQLVRHQNRGLNESLLRTEMREAALREQLSAVMGVLGGVGRALLPEFGEHVDQSGACEADSHTSFPAELVRSALGREGDGRLVDAAMEEMAQCHAQLVEFSKDEAISVLKSVSMPQLGLEVTKVSPFRMVAQRAALSAALHSLRLVSSRLKGSLEDEEASDAEMVRLTELCVECLSGEAPPVEADDEPVHPSSASLWDSVLAAPPEVSPLVSPAGKLAAASGPSLNVSPLGGSE